VSDERPNSLAAQAASWVPPWERAPMAPDRGYQASVREQDVSDQADTVGEPGTPASVGEPDAVDESDPRAFVGEPDAVDESGARASAAEPDAVDESGARTFPDEPDARSEPTEDEELDEADLTPDDDDVDEADPPPDDGAFDGPNPPGHADDVPPELRPLPGESHGNATVDAPTELDDDAASPVEVGVGPDLPVPASIDEAVEAEDDEPGAPVDAPMRPDGDDAADVFDAAPDDDAADRDDVDLPFAPEAPPPSEPVPSPDVATDHEVGAAVTRAEAAAIPAQGRKSARPVSAVGAESPRTPDFDLEERAPIDDAELRAALEAILLVVDEPVAEMQLAQILEEPNERVAAMLEDISARYTAAGHGFDLRRVAGGWRLYTRPEYAAYVERFVLDGQSARLTQAALETLAVVAYKQPVTRSRISAIRGVNCDGVMRTLATRGLIEECGTESETGAFLYRTTGLFLEKLGLNSVDQLPPLAPFLPDDVEEVLDASG
jgi:segregation and condensation protein B